MRRRHLFPVAAAVLALAGAGGPVAAGPPQQSAPVPRVCPFLSVVVPNAVLADALARPERIYGWNKRANPNAPASPYNTPRTWLSLRTPGQPYHPLYNGLIFVAGCPVAQIGPTAQTPTVVPPTNQPPPTTPPPTTPPPTTPPPTSPPVDLTMPAGPIFVGSYAEIPVAIDPGTGLTMDDLDIVVPDGDKAGHVSRSEPRGAAARSFMLLVGNEPGTYPILVTKHGTGVVLAAATFQSTDVWSDPDAGPNVWLERAESFPPPLPFLPIAQADAAADAPSRSARAATLPATPKVLIVIADTASNRFTGTEGADAVTTWKNEARDGVTVGSATRSTKKYYEELTAGTVAMDIDVRGPVSLSGAWSTYFNTNKSPQWVNLFQACASAVDATVDFGTVFSLVCVTKGNSSTEFAWPYAWGTTIATGEGNVSPRMISMPHDWPSRDGSGGRAIHVTLSHEFGHNLGLPDEYATDGMTQAVKDRDPKAWTLMSWDGDLPHVTVPERRWLDILSPSAIRTFDYGGATAPINATVELKPAELGNPPGGGAAGVEIKKAAGWSYWCEYRVGQATQIGDRKLPTDDRVLCTDIQAETSSRRAIVLLPNDADGDGPVLGNLQNYTEPDPNVADATLKLSVSAADGTKALLRVEYGPRGRPDPSIRPWPAGPTRPWQSYDIEVTNAATSLSPANANKAWAGHDNTVHATVHNEGTIDATGAVVNFYVKDLNAGGPSGATFLGSSTVTIPAGGSVTTEAPTLWKPPAKGHFCIVVQISPYSRMVGPFLVDEISSGNNEAQSNYDVVTSVSHSPASREAVTIKVTNPYPVPAYVTMHVDQTRTDFRTYLAHRWLRMAGGETRDVVVMFESTRDTPLQDPDRQRWAENHVSISSSIFNPLDPVVDHDDVLGGAEIVVRHGWATQVDDLRVNDTRVTGRVVRFDGQPVPGGWVVLEFTDASGGNPRVVTVTAPVAANGTFSATAAPLPWDFVTGYYVPVPGFAESESKRVPRP